MGQGEGYKVLNFVLKTFFRPEGWDTLYMELLAFLLRISVWCFGFVMLTSEMRITGAPGMVTKKVSGNFRFHPSLQENRAYFHYHHCDTSLCSSENAGNEHFGALTF